MLVGYARTSTIEQKAGFEAQRRDLEKAGCEKIFQEQVSSIGERKELERAIEFVREGDTLVITKLDRLARSIRGLAKTVDDLQAKKVELVILTMGVDTRTATGRLMFNMLGSFAEFERDMMIERQGEGIAKAKAEGKYPGRKPTARMHTDAVLAMRRNGVSALNIARELKIHVTSVHRILRDATTALDDDAATKQTGEAETKIDAAA